MARTILKEKTGCYERSQLLRNSVAVTNMNNEDLVLTVPSKTGTNASKSSGLTQAFRTKVLTKLVDEDDKLAVPYSRSEPIHPEDRMPIYEMVGMMLQKEERSRKRLKPNTPLPKPRQFPKLYSTSYRARISVWLREFCKDHNLSMTVFFKASQFLDLFLQHEHLWKQFIVEKLTDDDLYCMSLVALMIASKFSSMTLAVPQISLLTGKPNKTFIHMEQCMFNLATNRGVEDSSYVWNAVTYNHWTWPAIRRALENKLGLKMAPRDRGMSKLLFRRKIDFALHRAYLDMNGLACVRSSIVAIAAIDAVMLEAGLKSDKNLWKLFKIDRNWPNIKEINKRMCELLEQKNFCDIFTTYKKRWAAEDVMMKNSRTLNRGEIKNQEYETNTGPEHCVLDGPRQNNNRASAM